MKLTCGKKYTCNCPPMYEGQPPVFFPYENTQCAAVTSSDFPTRLAVQKDQEEQAPLETALQT